MAFTYSKKEAGQAALGTGLNLRIYSVDFASVTTGTVETGFDRVLHASFQNSVGVTADENVTISDGSVTIAGVTSNDAGTLLVLGA